MENPKANRYAPNTSLNLAAFAEKDIFLAGIGGAFYQFIVCGEYPSVHNVYGFGDAEASSKNSTTTTTDGKITA